MDIKEYEKILRSIPTTGVFVIREDNHEILYFNERVREISPHIHTGMPCHEMGNHSCANCPIHTIGDKQESQSICYNNPFGEMVDIVAIRTQWEGTVPAFIITVSPHVQVISDTYHKILRVNLTRDQYEVVKIRPEDRAIGYGTDSFSGWLGHFIYDGGVHPDDMNSFISFTRPNHIKKVLGSGQKSMTCCYRRCFGEDFRWNLMEIVEDPNILGGDQYVLMYIKDIHDILQESLELDDTNIRIQEVIRTLGSQNFGIYGVDLNTGETSLVRENGRNHTGWKSWTLSWDEFVNTHLIQQIHPVDREKFYETFSMKNLCRIRDSSMQKLDMLCRWRGEEDHEYRYMAIIAYFGQSHNAKNHVILALQNVDKRVRQEHALTLRDMQLAAILKSRYSVMTAVHLEDGQCERIMIKEDSMMKNVVSENYHQCFQKMLREEVYAEDMERFREIMSPEHLYQKAAATRDYAEEICQYRLSTPPLRWMEDHVIYIRQGTRMSVNILGRDITREKIQEELRQKGEQEQADIIRTLGGMFFATYYADLEQDTFRSVTQLKEVEKALKGKVNYATGLELYAKKFVHPDDRKEYLETLSIGNLRRTLSKKQPYVTVAYRKMPEKESIGPEDYGWIRSTAVMSQANASGQVRSIVYAAQDVTESKRKEMLGQQALQAACEAADYANASKQEFLSNMSHNIRTPMNGIIGMIKIAMDNVDNRERVKDCLEKASASSLQLLGTLNEILDISQIKSGEFHLKEEAFCLSALMEEVVSVVLPEIQKKGLRLKRNPMKTEHDNILSDQFRLRQIFLNILSNAVKYTPSGGELEIDVVEHESKEHGCSSYDFIFRDNGIGIDGHFLPHVFEPFSRAADDLDTSGIDGVGLGLSIAQNIARMMGGIISVESTLGKGSKFIVTIILKLQNPAECPESGVGPASDGHLEGSFQDCRILLVEDNELNQEIAMELIGEIGARVECAADGRKGLQRFAEMPEGYYDLILMDIQMPVMNGFEATRAIRKLPRADAATIPILALSANVSVEDIALCRESGMNGHIAKPLHIPQLIERMDYWLNGAHEKKKA